MCSQTRGPKRPVFDRRPDRVFIYTVEKQPRSSDPIHSSRRSIHGLDFSIRKKVCEAFSTPLNTVVRLTAARPERLSDVGLTVLLLLLLLCCCCCSFSTAVVAAASRSAAPLLAPSSSRTRSAVFRICRPAIVQRTHKLRVRSH